MKRQVPHRLHHVALLQDREDLPRTAFPWAQALLSKQPRVCEEYNEVIKNTMRVELFTSSGL